MQREYEAIVTMPFGALGLRLEAGVLVNIDFLPEAPEQKVTCMSAADAVCKALSEYLANPQKTFNIPLKLKGTPFQQKVWDAIASIPSGKTITYTELAEKVGSGARAVANACGANPIPVVIPCHRVVARNGLGGFMQGRTRTSLTIKQWLLAHERGEPFAAG